MLEDLAQVAPRAALGGSVRVGALAQIGIGAVVKNNIAVGMGCVIGDSTASMRRHKKEEETPSADTLEKGEMPIAQENPEIRGYPDASEAGGNQEAERENS